MKNYSVENETELVMFVDEIPHWHVDKNEKNAVIESNHIGVTKFIVIKHSKRDSILDKYFEDPKDIALSSRALHDKVLRD